MFFISMTARDQWPMESGSVDAAIADCVIEYLAEPVSFFSECKRVLKQAGYLCIHTANILCSIGIGSFLVPNRYHANVLKAVQEGRKAESVFSTVYRCNTVHRLRRIMMSNYGFDHACYGFESEPHYLSFSKITYTLGVMHQKYAPAFLKPTIFACERSA